MHPILKGLLVDLPSMDGIGVILGAHRLNQHTYIGVILGSDKRVYWAKFILKATETDSPVEYLDSHSYDFDKVYNFIKDLG